MKKNIFLLSILPTFLSAQINFQWAGAFAGNGGAVSVNDIVLNKNGHAYSTGSFVKTVDFNPSQNVSDTFFLSAPSSTFYSDIFVSRLNSNGQHVWTKHISGNGQNAGKSITMDQNGNVYVTGIYSNSTDFDPSSAVSTLSNSGCFVLKLDSSGNFIWVKEFKGSFSGSVSGNSIEVDKLGNIVVSGVFKGTPDFDPNAAIVNLTNNDGFGTNDGFICKLDANGSFKWVKHIASTFEDNAQSTTFDSQNNVYSCGVFSGVVDFISGIGTETITTSGQKDVYVIKHDENGNYVWTKTIGGVAEETIGAITIDANQNIYLAGGFSSKVDFNPSTVIADTFNLKSLDQKDVFVVKLDNNGNFIFAKSFGKGNGVAEATDISVDKYENIYTCGQFASTCNFNPNGGTNNLIANGGNDMFISKLDNFGNYVEAASVGGNNYNDFIKAIQLDTLGNIYFCGSFFQVVDFNLTATAYNLDALGYDDGFIAKYGQTGFVGINEKVVDNSLIFVYPIPASDILTIDLKTKDLRKIAIHNNFGQLVYESLITDQQIRIAIENLQSGIYVLTIAEEGNIHTAKFIKQ